jgi:hypothetical protein
MKVCVALEVPDSRGSENRLVDSGVQWLHVLYSMLPRGRESGLANAAEAVYAQWPKAETYCQHAPSAPCLFLNRLLKYP